MFIAALNAFECTQRPSFTEFDQFDQFDQHAGGRNSNRNGRVVPDLGVTIVENGIRNTEEDNAVMRRTRVADPDRPIGDVGALKTFDADAQAVRRDKCVPAVLSTFNFMHCGEGGRLVALDQGAMDIVGG